MRVPLAAIILTMAVGVAGCSDKGLRTVRSTGTGPDEFKVLPVKPLTAPKDYQVLPAPTPGGTNLVDLDPKADAVAALGGNPAALNPNGPVPASDGALVAQTSRYGVPANIRTALAESDEEFRKRKARSGRIRLFPVDRYEQVYRPQALEPFAQNEWFRNYGAATPTAPPRFD